jgi:hypothetical protein
MSIWMALEARVVPTFVVVCSLLVLGPKHPARFHSPPTIRSRENKDPFFLLQQEKKAVKIPNTKANIFYNVKRLHFNVGTSHICDVR